MEAALPKYRIGNGLYELQNSHEYPNDKEAWEGMRARFSRGSGTSRIAYLSREETIRVTPLLLDGMERKQAGENTGVTFGEQDVTWRTIMAGYTAEPWPDGWPDNLE
jgi:hypothetical protein